MENKKMRGFEVLPECKEKYESMMKKLGLENSTPKRSTRCSSGYDIRALEDKMLYPGEVFPVGTGLTAYMQEDEELQLRSRSSLAKKGITLANCPGTVDSDYYGHEFKFLMLNQTSEVFCISAGDRIGQAVFSKYLITDDDNSTEERKGGFGSTGVN